MHLVTYQGVAVAAATRDRFFLSDELENRPATDQLRRFVTYMCAYVGEVLAGRLPAPLNETDARRFARACLIPTELLERADVERDVYGGAIALCVPEAELVQAIAEHRGDIEARPG